MCAEIYSPFGGSESTARANPIEKLFLCRLLRTRTRNGANNLISGAINLRHNGAFSSPVNTAARVVQVSLHLIMFANKFPSCTQYKFTLRCPRSV